MALKVSDMPGGNSLSPHLFWLKALSKKGDNYVAQWSRRRGRSAASCRRTRASNLSEETAKPLLALGAPARDARPSFRGSERLQREVVVGVELRRPDEGHFSSASSTRLF